MIRSLLIANRGEIACRIIRTAQRMGIATVAVYSDADAQALHVRQADRAVHIGPSPARESYLRGDRIIAAAKEAGAEAIHPGYGFLSENAEFAEAVEAAGLTWVGAPPAAIRAMGLKDAAKALMLKAGVPVTPGYLGEDQAPERLHAEADRIGYPVLIKAVAGGGGKGMRRVEASGDFLDALGSCRREAASSFGDDRVLIEKYITSPRHIEVQVFGDTHGNVVHLFERDCSLQRRHQKVIEEAPAPGMDAATRAAVCAAAVNAAKAVDYVGAGTIEFIADASAGLSADRIWFMEMNTRLQVEHPVTEAITGQDLVEWQLRVASGEPLPLRQEDLEIDGWAVEARLYAENPLTGFLPSVGKLEYLRLQSRGVRVDTGVDEGATISPFYDPMVAKVIAHEATREAALERLAAACGHVNTWPVHNNAGFLTALLQRRELVAGQVDTGFIARELDALVAGADPSDALLETAATRLMDGECALPEVWIAARGLRLNAPRRRTAWLLVDGALREVATTGRDDFTYAEALGDALLMVENGWPHVIGPARTSGAAGEAGGDGAILAPMPGRVTAVDVAAGQRVTKGQRLVTLEAMKMEHSLTAPFEGEVAEVCATVGAQVSESALLVKLTPA